MILYYASLVRYAEYATIILPPITDISPLIHNTAIIDINTVINTHTILAIDIGYAIISATQYW